jgi:amino acid permease
MWYAFGKRGLWALELLLLTFFMGVLVAYLAAVNDFLSDTPFYHRGVVSLLAGLGMALLSLVHDMGDLSRASALGLIILASSCLLVALVGIQRAIVQQQPSSLLPLNWWPVSRRGWSHWFGIVVIGYGVVPLTYNLRDSMAEPRRMVEATSRALTAVFAFYLLLGVGLYSLFPNVQGELLQELGNGLIPTLTRLAMAGVVLLTAPLLLVPCSELVEGKLFPTRQERSRQEICFVRCSLGSIAVGMALLVPSFVEALALVGCACVGVLGLCLPPLLHLQLASEASFAVRCVDGFCLLCGGIATIVSTLCAVGLL